MRQHGRDGKNHGRLAVPTVAFDNRDLRVGNKRFPEPVDVNDGCLISPFDDRNLYFLSLFDVYWHLPNVNEVLTDTYRYYVKHRD